MNCHASTCCKAIGATAVLILAAACGDSTGPPRGSEGIAFSTYLGGSAFEHIRDVAVDAAGNVYVAGGTESGSFPTTSGAFQRSHNPGTPESSQVSPMDVFVAKFSPSGNLLWSTYLGGPNYDRAYAVEVDAQGFVYVAGRAGAGFPVTAGAFQTAFQGGQEAVFYGNQDGFVCKLRPDGSARVFCSYFGTGDPRIVRDIAVDGSGDIYLASGRTSGSYTSAVAGAFTNGPRGGDDAVIAKVRSDGAAVLWATYLGGAADESNQNSVRLDGAGNPYLLFTTASSGIATAGAYQQTYGGGGDVFVTKLNPASGAPVWGTYLGGSANESTETHELAVDAAGNVYIAAPTQSTDFPTTAGAFSRTPDPLFNQVFISKISPDGARLVASTLLGGTANERPEGVAVDGAGNVYVTGVTGSADFPLSQDAHQRTMGGGPDAFAVILSADLSTLLYASYLGGASHDLGRGAAVGTDGSFVIVGETGSSGWPHVNAHQSGFGGGSADGFIIRLR